MTDKSDVRPLTETNEDRADNALENFGHLVNKLDAAVAERISMSQPMGGLPQNPNQFLTVWTKNCKVNISRATYYKTLEPHSELRNQAEKLYKKVKHPPIAKSERDLYENDIADLKCELEKLAEKHLEVIQKLRSIDFEYKEIVLKKEEEIRVLKRRLAIKKSSSSN